MALFESIPKATKHWDTSPHRSATPGWVRRRSLSNQDGEGPCNGQAPVDGLGLEEERFQGGTSKENRVLLIGVPRVWEDLRGIIRPCRAL